MPPKTGKKHSLGKNRSQSRRLVRHLEGANKRSAFQPVIRTAIPPKPPQNGYLIWGRHAVFAALANSERRIAQIYAASDHGKSELQSQLGALPSERYAKLPPIQHIDRQRLDALASPHDKAVHQGMAAAVWPVEPPNLDDFLLQHQNEAVRLVLLDQVSDPRNVGAIMRSARAFGVTALITTFRHAAEETGVLARAASGALDHLFYLRVTNLVRAILRLQQDHFIVAGLAGDGDMTVDNLYGIDRLALVLGAEGTGLRRLSRRHCDHLVRIDINQGSESLNVSNAAAIALYAASNRLER